MPELRDEDGRRIVLRVGQDGPMGTTAALNKVRIENSRAASWLKLDDPERAMVQAVVRQALRRLLESPDWIPGSVQLGTRRLDVSLVIELDVDRVTATLAAEDLDLEVALARVELQEAIEALEDPPPQ
jgi:hypothetical protein